MANKTTYILIDTSGSMRDCAAHSRGSAVNQAMKEVVEEVLPQVLTEKDAEMHPYIAVLTFSSSGVEWHIPRQPMEDVVGTWMPIEDAKFNGGTPTGEAIERVIEDINTGNYGEPDPFAVAPALLLISDGEPNGSAPTYEEALARAEKENPQFCRAFRYSNRIAIGIQVSEEGRQSLQKFGRLSGSMTESGHEAYYDCTDDNTRALIDIIKSCTMALSANA